MGEHERGFVGPERMDLERQVEPAEKRGALLLDSLHRADGGTAQENAQTGPAGYTITEGAQDARQVGRLLTILVSYFDVSSA